MQNSDPWNDSSTSGADSGSGGFADNFTVDQATILELPDSDKYLESLEKRLSKIQPKAVVDPQLNKKASKALAKDLIASLKAKRDEIFKEELGVDREWEDADQTTMRTIQKKLMDTEIFKEVTRKVCPQLLAVDAEELKSLTVFDFLNDITEKFEDSKDQTTGEKAD